MFRETKPPDGSGREVLRLAVSAMATRFELVLPVGTGTPSARDLRAAGEEALAEIVRVENWLSIYRPTSELSLVNQSAGNRPVRVSPPVFHLLQRVGEICQRTNGTFDPTVGPLIKLWREGYWPSHPLDQQLLAIREAVGWGNIELDSTTGTVRFHHPETRLDLGSVGKGWALDRAVELLGDAGVGSALLQGGTSSVRVMGLSPSGEGWPVEIAPGDPTQSLPQQSFQPLVISLSDESLSVSATWGSRRVNSTGEEHGHLFDPRTGTVVLGHRRAVVVGPTATDTDALSTALLVTGVPMIGALAGGNFGPYLRGWWG